MISEYLVPGEAARPEGIVEDPDGVHFYVSSIGDGTIFRGRVDQPEAEPWLPGGADGRTSLLGLAIDSRSRRLYGCGGTTGHVFAHDLVTGEQLARQTVPTTPTLLNDLIVAGDHVYVTDSERPVVWRLALGGDGGGGGGADGDGDEVLGAPEQWLDVTAYGGAPDEQHYLNGIVSTPDGTALVIAAQGTGVLWRADLATGHAQPIDLGGSAVNGDGLLFVGDVLYVCDNTDEPDGSVRMWLTALRLSPDARSGTLLGRWERPLRDTPTTAAYLDGRLLLVNAQHGRRFIDEPVAAPFTISALVPPVR